MGRVRAAHWGKREWFSLAEEETLFYSFCSLFFIDRQLCLKEGSAAGERRAGKPAPPTVAHFNSHPDWSVRRTWENSHPKPPGTTALEIQISRLAHAFLQD